MSSEVFTTAIARVVSVAGIAENVPVRIGELTIPEDFHVIKPTKGEKGGTPEVLLGRSFLKTAEFKLIYYDEIFTFSVGNVIEIFHLTPPPRPRKKAIHQLQQDKGKAQAGSPREKNKIKAKTWEGPKGRIRDTKDSRSKSPQPEGEKKKEVLKMEKEKRKKKKESDEK
ncbi:hypothetical protein PIB30_061820 [Stylosanthes scabra]|uniref:Uncharacterized protein n=1 Tax=Stylosanthes scabra TaxID=79078 RepID=A0ABU6YIF3_9FABA|nr:hypothetical protein [Stylosanthes scabra]